MKITSPESTESAAPTPVCLVPSGRPWFDAFTREADRLAGLSSPLVGIHHIGSTAISGLALVRPVVDLLVCVRPLRSRPSSTTSPGMLATISALAGAGYVVWREGCDLTVMRSDCGGFAVWVAEERERFALDSMEFASLHSGPSRIAHRNFYDGLRREASPLGLDEYERAKWRYFGYCSAFMARKRGAHE